MTSFNINGPSKMPQVTEAQNMMNNGGGGNTGYLESGRKKKKKKEEEFDPSILADNGEDKFERSEVEYEDDDDYYGRNASNDGIEEKQASKENNSETIKDKFLGLIGKISAPKKEESPQDMYSHGDFLTFSKNNDV